MLDECRKQDDELAQRLIVKELPDFGHLTSIDIAVSAEDQDFIAHPTCQALLSKLWMGTMELTTHTWQVKHYYGFLKAFSRHSLGMFMAFLTG